METDNKQKRIDLICKLILIIKEAFIYRLLLLLTKYNIFNTKKYCQI